MLISPLNFLFHASLIVMSVLCADLSDVALRLALRDAKNIQKVLWILKEKYPELGKIGSHDHLDDILMMSMIKSSLDKDDPSLTRKKVQDLLFENNPLIVKRLIELENLISKNPPKDGSPEILKKIQDVLFEIESEGLRDKDIEKRLKQWRKEFKPIAEINRSIFTEGSIALASDAHPEVYESALMMHAQYAMGQEYYNWKSYQNNPIPLGTIAKLNNNRKTRESLSKPRVLPDSSSAPIGDPEFNAINIQIEVDSIVEALAK